MFRLHVAGTGPLFVRGAFLSHKSESGEDTVLERQEKEGKYSFLQFPLYLPLLDTIGKFVLNKLCWRNYHPFYHGWWNVAPISSRGFSCGVIVKNLPTDTGDAGAVDLILGLGKPPGEGNSNPLQYSCLKNSMDRGAWWPMACGVTKTWTWLSILTHISSVKFSNFK